MGRVLHVRGPVVCPEEQGPQPTSGRLCRQLEKQDRRCWLQRLPHRLVIAPYTLKLESSALFGFPPPPKSFWKIMKIFFEIKT